MQGTTFKINAADYRTVVVLASGEALATRRDGGPHRLFSSQGAAEAFLGDKLVKWEVGRTRNSDDNWTAEVNFDDNALAVIRATSRKVYGENLAPAPPVNPRDAARAELAELEDMAARTAAARRQIELDRQAIEAAGSSIVEQEQRTAEARRRIEADQAAIRASREAGIGHVP